MRSQRFAEPRVFAVRGNDLSLSAQALMELMQAVLRRKLPFRFRARGLSMTPFIRDGDVITLKPMSSYPVRTGEIVAFRCPESDRPVVHRVVARSAAGLFFQGDSVHAHQDGPVPLENLLGRVVCIERSGKRIRLGLGPERYLIALLSRCNLLVPLRFTLRKILPRRNR